MGIKNLHKFLQKHVPDYCEEKSLSAYRGCKVAVDTNIYLYRYKSIYKDNWSKHFVDFLIILVKNGLDCLFVYDTDAPIEKQDKKDERKMDKINANNRIQEIEEAREVYHREGTIPLILREIIERRSTRIKQLLPNNFSQQFVYDQGAIDKELNILRNKVVSVTRRDTQRSRELLDLFEISHCDSLAEAETLCAQLCVHGIVDAVLSNDTDVLAYGCPTFLAKLELNDKPHRHRETVMEIKFAHILSALQMTKEQFRDLCIMCGTDYNKNIYHVGNDKAFRLLQKYGSIEEIAQNTTKDITILNHVRVRELFHVPEESPDYPEIKHSALPSINTLREYACIHNFRCSPYTEKNLSR